MSDLIPQRPQQRQEPSIGRGLAIAGIAALILVNPVTWLLLFFVILFAFLLVMAGGQGCFALLDHYGAWCLVPLLGLSLLGPIRNRISGKQQIEKLQQKLGVLNEQLTETQAQLLHAEQELEYYKLIEKHNQK